MGIKSVYSQADSVAQAVAELKAKIGDFDTRLLIVFASIRYDQMALTQSLQQTFPQAEIMGCSSAGELVSGQMLQDSVVAMALGADMLSDLKIEVIENLGTQLDVARAFQSFETHYGLSMAQLDYKQYVGLVLIDGLSMVEEKLMEELGDRTNITFIGGSAGDNLKFEATFVYAHGKAYTQAAVLALLKPARGFDIIKTQSFAVTEQTLTPTEVDHATRTVVSFDGKPAAEAYAEAIGVELDQISHQQFMTYPVGLMDGSEPFVRSPKQFNQKGLAFHCNVVEGMPLSLLLKQDIITDTRQAVAEKQAELGQIAGLIDFQCVLRMLQLQHEEKTQAYGEIFKDIPMIGFSTYGEELITHVNQTSTMLVFK